MRDNEFKTKMDTLTDHIVEFENGLREAFPNTSGDAGDLHKAGIIEDPDVDGGLTG